MRAKTLTKTTLELESELKAIRVRERKMRARAIQLRRRMAAAGRRAEMQRLCLLGAALIAWCERDSVVHEAACEFLRQYVTRDTDRAALAGTPFEIVPAPDSAE